jgi:hypothetical protein
MLLVLPVAGRWGTVLSVSLDRAEQYSTVQLISRFQGWEKPNFKCLNIKCLNCNTAFKTIQRFAIIIIVKQCWGSMTFWCGSGSADPYLCLMDPASNPFLTLDSTPFFSDIKDAKKKFFIYFFLITYVQAHYLQSYKILFFNLQALLFNAAKHHY